MTLHEAAEMALEALEAHAEVDVYDFFHHRDLADKYYEVMRKLSAALKEQDNADAV